MNGLFITFEGVEGCGKTTQIQYLKHHLESRGYQCVLTREPGGTPIGEQIRQILLNPENTAMDPTTELLLYAAARAQHVAQRIAPALEAGKAVLSDRFADSTTAYQGAGRNLPPETLAQLHTLSTHNLQPHRTYLLDLDPAQGLERARGRGRSDRLEQESLDFHHRVRQAFLDLAKQEPERIKVIDGSQEVKDVAEAIEADVDALLSP